jgi:hypothetical protein
MPTRRSLSRHAASPSMRIAPKKRQIAARAHHGAGGASSEVRPEGSTDESYIAIRSDGMLPWLKRLPFVLSLLVFAPREINMRTLRTWSVAVTLIGSALSNATAKAAPILAIEVHHGGSKVTIPATTPLTVKLDQVLIAKTAESGESFTVTFTEPVRVDGIVLIPLGASGAGLVRRKSFNSTEVELNSVFVNGRSYRVTSPITISQKGALRAGTKFTFDLMLSLNVVE